MNYSPATAERAAYFSHELAALSAEEAATVESALSIVNRRVIGAAITSPSDLRDFLRLHLGPLEHEEFAIVFLDAQNRVIAFEKLFRGTIRQTSVHPREVLKRALAVNASAVILAHNHPSGSPEPSRADERLTDALKQALALVDVSVLDHVVVTTGACVSFSELGLL